MSGLLNPNVVEVEILRGLHRYLGARQAELDKKLTTVRLDREDYLAALAARHEVASVLSRMTDEMKRRGILS